MFTLNPAKQWKKTVKMKKILTALTMSKSIAQKIMTEESKPHMALARLLSTLPSRTPIPTHAHTTIGAIRGGGVALGSSQFHMSLSHMYPEAGANHLG
jgi:hypothetical protein